MIELLPEPFDSEVWNKKVCRLYVRAPFAEEELREALAAERPDVVFAFSPCSPGIMETLCRAGFRFISIRSTYALPSGKDVEEPALPSAFRTVSLAQGIRASDEDIRGMAATIGAASRYFNDPRIQPEEAMRLYTAWIRNSLFRGYANEAIAVLHEDRMVGIATLKVKEGTGIIDILGVSPSFQRLGLGGVLLGRAVGFFRSRGIQDIVVVTEGENLKANAFYQHKGFVIRDFSMVFHAHPSSI
jgi:ribosomal protein S18 acetylase RimI-like enzyme